MVLQACDNGRRGSGSRWHRFLALGSDAALTGAEATGLRVMRSPLQAHSSGVTEWSGGGVATRMEDRSDIQTGLLVTW